VTGYIELGLGDYFLRSGLLGVPYSKLFCGWGPKIRNKSDELAEFMGTDSWLAFWILWHFVIEFHVRLILKF